MSLKEYNNMTFGIFPPLYEKIYPDGVVCKISELLGSFKYEIFDNDILVKKFNLNAHTVAIPSGDIVCDNGIRFRNDDELIRYLINEANDFASVYSFKKTLESI